MGNCIVLNCDRTPVSKGLCYSHYNGIKYGGKEISQLKPIKGKVKKCKVEVCDRDSSSLGLCSRHYSQYNNCGKSVEEMTAIRTNEGYSICLINNCYRIAQASGLCLNHRRAVSKGKPLAELKGTGKLPAKCKAVGCDNPVKAKGLCPNHYMAEWLKSKK